MSDNTIHPTPEAMFTKIVPDRTSLDLLFIEKIKELAEVKEAYDVLERAAPGAADVLLKLLLPQVVDTYVEGFRHGVLMERTRVGGWLTEHGADALQKGYLTRSDVTQLARQVLEAVPRSVRSDEHRETPAQRDHAQGICFEPTCPYCKTAKEKL